MGSVSVKYTQITASQKHLFSWMDFIFLLKVTGNFLQHMQGKLATDIYMLGLSGVLMSWFYIFFKLHLNLFGDALVTTSAFLSFLLLVAYYAALEAV
jgi:hypothetical protein